MAAHRNRDDGYDVIIVGAGIGGLICGCYLAKNGMNVLIAEQHHKPGGYCTSFRRGKYTFDAAAHCFGGYREGGLTRQVFQDLALDRKLDIFHADPSNIVITPKHKVSFWADLNRTISEFQSAFPEEKNSIASFFRFIVTPDSHSFSRIRTHTLQELLDQHFTSSELKTVLTAPLLGLGGLPASRMSAFIGAKLLSEFLFDGGYHPARGMQSLADALAERLKELGGELRLSCPVKKIETENKTVSGVTTERNEFIPARYVVANCDARQTFFKLLDERRLDREFARKLHEMTPSISNFILYLGLDAYYAELPQPGTTYCFFSHYDLDRAFRAAQKGDMEGYGGYMFYISTEQPQILAITPTAFKTKSYWSTNKQQIAESFIQRLEQNSIPHLSHHITYKEAATPYTLYRYTKNYRGASFGWAGLPTQLAVEGFKRAMGVHGLYLAGHWTTHGLGISGVAYIGRDIAKIIVRRNKLC